MNIRRAILMHLYKAGTYTDIGEFMMSQFKDENQEAYTELNLTIAQLKKEDLLRFTANSHPNMQFGHEMPMPDVEPRKNEILTFDVFRKYGLIANAKITPLGVEKVEDWLLKEQLMKVHTSVMNTNLISRTTAVLTVVIVSITAWIGYLQYTKPNGVSVEQKQFDSLYKQIRLLQELQQRQIGNSRPYQVSDTIKVRFVPHG